MLALYVIWAVLYFTYDPLSVAAQKDRYRFQYVTPNGEVTGYDRSRTDVMLMSGLFILKVIWQIVGTVSCLVLMVMVGLMLSPLWLTIYIIAIILMLIFRVQISYNSQHWWLVRGLMVIGYGGFLYGVSALTS